MSVPDLAPDDDDRALYRGLWIELELRPLSARFLYVVQ